MKSHQKFIVILRPKLIKQNKNSNLNFLSIAHSSKILELEEELKVVGNNMKSLEVSEQEVY